MEKWTLSKAVARKDLPEAARVVEAIFEAQTARDAVPKPIREVVVLLPHPEYEAALYDWKCAREQNGYRVVLHDLTKVVGPAPFSPHDVRRFLASRDLDGRVRYLLIVGEHGRIPMLAAYSVPYPGAEESTYTDYYYGDLEGSWDSNGNGVFGEAGDEVDYSPEFLVGRIPAFISGELRSVLNRQLACERRTAPVVDRVLLLAGQIEIPGDAALVQEGVSLLLAGRGISSTRMYDTGMFVYDSYSVALHPNYLIGQTSVPKVWEEGDYRIVYALSHGNERGLYRTKSTGSRFLGIPDVGELDLSPPGGSSSRRLARSRGPSPPTSSPPLRRQTPIEG